MVLHVDYRCDFNGETGHAVSDGTCINCGKKCGPSIRDDVDLVMRSLAHLIAPGAVKEPSPSVEESREFLKVLTGE